MARPIGVCRRRKGGNQQPVHASGSALHVMHAVHASGTEQQAAGGLDVAKLTPHPDRGHRRRCDHFRCYRCLQRRQSGVRLVQPQLESALVIAEWPASRPEPHAIRLAAGSAIGPVAAARALHGRHSAGLDCHGRLACAEAMRTAIMGSPFAPLTPHFIWHISRQLAGAPDVALSSPASASPSIEPLLRSSVSVL